MDINPNLPERFWKNVDKSNDCWKWTGPHSNGYAKYYRNGKFEMVNRVIVDNPPVNKKVCKSCKNVWCINPAHSYIDTTCGPEPIYGPQRRRKINVDDLPAIFRGESTDHLDVPRSFIEKIRLYFEPVGKCTDAASEPPTVDFVTR